MKIRAHFALIVAAALVPVIVFSGVALSMIRDSSRESVIRGMQETVRATALSVDRELVSAEAALQVLGTSLTLASGDMASLYAQARVADRGYGAWSIVRDEQGRQIINTSLPFGAELPLRDLPQQVNQVLSGQRTVVSDLQVGNVTQRFITTISVPVELANGKRYVMSSAFGAEFFATAIVESKVPPDWTLAIIDTQGKFIARSRNPERMVGKAARAELVEAARRHDSGFIRHATLEGVDSFDVYAHNQVSGWTVALAAPSTAIEARTRNAVMIASLGLFAAIIAAAGVAALFSRHLVRSIDAIGRAANALVKGEGPTPIKSRVDEIKQLSASLSGAGALLEEERVSRRAAERERERLLDAAHEARLQAEAENFAKDKFLAMLGHELRNPLSAISGAIAITRNSNATPDMRLHAEDVIARQSAHLSHIVDDLLDHSRVTMGKILLDRSPVDLGRIVTGCIESLRSSSRPPKVAIHVQVESAWIDADLSRIEQIVSNLVGNAIKFTPEEGRIDVSVRAENGCAILQVKDTGTGIGEELMPVLFDPFVQGDPPLNHTNAGLGIGLNLVRQLVDLHGGMVEASSDGVGKGSLFTVRFPLHGEVCEAPAVEEAKAVELRGSVLLIEDNEDARSMMSALMDITGVQVLEAPTGEQGIAVAIAQRPAAAIVDIGLPDMSGYEVAQRLRSHPQTASMLLVALTGYGLEEDVQRAIAAGFDFHFAKPVDYQRLIGVISGKHA